MELNKKEHILFALIVVAIFLFIFTSALFTGSFVGKKQSIQEEMGEQQVIEVTEAPTAPAGETQPAQSEEQQVTEPEDNVETLETPLIEEKIVIEAPKTQGIGLLSLTPGGELLYQENGNATLCTGTWNSTYPCSNVNDSDWLTYGMANSGSAVFHYVNYSKPVYAVSAKWQIDDGLTNTNISVPTACFNKSVLQFRVGSNKVVANDTSWRCWDGASWYNLYGSSFTASAFEEAVWWNISSQINSCDTLTEENSTYVLSADIQGNQSNGRCIDIQANNVTFDCAGYNITGNISDITYGIYINDYNNTVIQNCSVYNYTTGIRFINSHNSILTNNTVNNNSFGVYIDHVTNSTLTNNTANDNEYIGISMQYSSNNNLVNNEESNNDNRGLGLFHESHNNTITNNTANGNTNHGILLGNNAYNNTFITCIANNNKNGIYSTGSSNNTVINNTLNDNDYGIFLTSASHDYTLTNNTANNNFISGIWLDASPKNILTNNTAYSNIQYGIYLYNSSNNTLTGNTVNNNFVSGIILDSSSKYNNLTNNTANLNTKYGIHINSSSNNTLTNNTANTNLEFGVFLNSSSNNTLTENTAYNNANVGIYIYNSSNNTLTNNTAYENVNYGIFLSTSSNNNLTRNNASSNNDRGIYLYLASYNILTKNAVNLNDHGIYLWYSYKNNLTDNTANLNTNYGIILLNSADNILTNNTVNSTTVYYGIYLQSSSYNILTNNTAYNNLKYGIYLLSSSYNNLTNNNASLNQNSGIFYSSSDNNILTNNTAYNNTVYGILIRTSSYNALTNNTANLNTNFGIVILNSANNSLTDNTVDFNPYGIVVESSSNNTMTHNTANSNTKHGILISSSPNNTLIYNTAYNNTQFGIYLTYSSNNNLTNNNASSNQYGVYLEDSSNNTIINNNASFNVVDFYSSSSSNNTVTNITTNSTQSSFTYSGTISLKSATAPAGGDPPGYVNLGKYLELSIASGGWTYMNISYTDTDISSMDESTLVLWGQNAGIWSSDLGGGVLSSVNQSFNYVYGNITNSGSIYAPMASVCLTDSDCDDSDACTIDFCELGTGLCHNNFAPTIICDDSNPCTDDTCVSPTGCVYVNNADPCDDGSGCTTGDYCSGGACTGTDSCDTITDCMTITTPNSFYNLTANLTGNQSSGICIDIQTDNVTLDCDSYSLIGNVSTALDTYAVYAGDVNNITVNNCSITNYTYGIEFSNSNDSLAENNFIRDINNTGINIWASYNTNVTHNEIRNVSNIAISVFESNNSVINNNIVYDAITYEDPVIASGIDVDYSNYTRIENNEVYDSNASFMITNAEHTTVNANIAKDITLYCYTFSQSSNTTTNNNRFENCYYGIFIQDCPVNNSFDNNTVTHSVDSAFFVINPEDAFIDCVSAPDNKNTITNLTIDDIKIGFNYYGNMSINFSSKPAGGNPTGYTDIRKYLNITILDDLEDAWLYLNISYNDTDVSGFNESSIKMWKYSSSIWNQTLGTATNDVDTANNVVYANITNFSSIFAPMVTATEELIITPVVAPSSGRTSSSGGFSDTAVFMFTNILSNVYSSSSSNNPTINIINIIIQPKQTLTGQLSVKQLTQKPTEVTEPSNKTFKYFQFTSTNLNSTLIVDAEIHFRVLKSWVTQNNVDINSIKMYRYSNGWQALPTESNGSDNTYYYFKASTAGFSYFAIGENIVLTAPAIVPVIVPAAQAVCGDGICDMLETSIDCQVDCPGPTAEERETGVNILAIFGLSAFALVTVIVVIVLLVIRHYRIESEEMMPVEIETPPEKEHMLEAYIRKQMSRGHSQQEIITALISSGWTEEQIESAFELAIVQPQKEEALIEYAQRQLTKGYTEEQITQKLLNVGWKQKEVSHIIKMAQKTLSKL